MQFKTNLAEVIADIRELQSDVKRLDAATEVALDWFAADMAVEVVDNVKQRGQATDGTILNTKSGRPIGRYSQRHGTARQISGRQTLIVDLSFTGDMWRSWNVIESRPGFRGVGFMNDTANDKADSLETYYGKTIFVPSDDALEKGFPKAEGILFNELDISR